MPDVISCVLRYQAIDNKRPPLNKRSWAFRLIFEMLINALLNFRFSILKNNKRTPERAAGAKILSFYAFTRGFSTKNITFFMLINAPLISPKIQHANKRTFEFQNPEILPDNKRVPFKKVHFLVSHQIYRL